MLKFVHAYLLLTLAVLAVFPAVSYARCRRRHAVIPNRARWVVSVYYATLALPVGAIIFVVSTRYNLSTLAFSLLEMAAFVVAITGPLVASQIRLRFTEAATNACPACGDNSTERPGGACPECGRAVVASEPVGATLFSRRFLAWYAPLLLALVCMMGYTMVDEVWYCSECGLARVTTVHELRVPLGGPTLARFDGGERIESASQADPLVKALDPKGGCKHEWIGNGFDARGLTHGSMASGVSPTLVGVGDLPDFMTFMAANPALCERIREDLRQGQPGVRGWVFEEYLQWREDKQ